MSRGATEAVQQQDIDELARLLKAILIELLNIQKILLTGENPHVRRDPEREPK